MFRTLVHRIEKDMRSNGELELWPVVWPTSRAIGLDWRGYKSYPIKTPEKQAMVLLNLI